MHGNDNGKQSVLRQQPTFAQNGRADVSDTETVDKDRARGNCAVEFCAAFAEFKHIAVVHHENMRRVNAHFFGKLCVAVEMTRFSVNGNKILRL